MEPARKSYSVTVEGAAPGRGSGTSEVDGRYADAALDRGAEIELMVDGRPLRAFQGESVAAALLATGKRALRTTSRNGEPRGHYCGIGVCFDCVMTIDGRPSVRACQTPVRDGLRVETQKGDGQWALSVESKCSPRDAPRVKGPSPMRTSSAHPRPPTKCRCET